jgi:DNA modification methylase
MKPPLNARRRWEVRSGDCLALLPKLDASSIDVVVTDPPYGINIASTGWDHPARLDPQGPHGRRSRTNSSAGFQRFCERWAQECFRVLKPRIVPSRILGDAHHSPACERC